MKTIFDGVYGYENVKNELYMIRNWIMEDKIINDNKLSIPNGIIFYGEHGNGKTLFMRKFAQSFDAPIFTIEGKEKNVCDEIYETFAKAREEKFAVVLIDEIDLLTNNDAQITRTLQSQLDGLNQKGHLLILATANNINSLNPALLRPGRLGRKIYIAQPDRKTREKLFVNFFSLLEIPFDNIDMNYIARISTFCNGASIKAIANDVYLRCRHNVTVEDIETSYERINHNNIIQKSDEIKKDMIIAIHEAGHALMTMKFAKYYTFYLAKFTSEGGLTDIYENDEHEDTINKRECEIQISMGGYLAERVVNGYHDIGSYKDYQKAFAYCTGFIESICIKDITCFIPSYRSNDTRFESSQKRRANEKKANKLLKKYERKTYVFLKKHKKALIDLANLIYEKGKITHREILSINEEEKTEASGSFIRSFANSCLKPNLNF
jgi:cell division protease FtsH